MTGESTVWISVADLQSVLRRISKYFTQDEVGFMSRMLSGQSRVHSLDFIDEVRGGFR